MRSFPLLALIGALLYRLDPAHLVPLSAGLLALSAWLTCYYWRHVDEIDAEGLPNVGLMVPICNVLAYLLGPVALAEPPWVAIGATVAAVLLLTARKELHGFARRIELSEIVNAGRFLLLTGFVLPLLPGHAGDRPDADHAASGVAGDGRGLHGVVCQLPAAALCRAARRRTAGGAAGRPLFLDRDDGGAGAAGARRSVLAAADRGGDRAGHRGDVSAAADHHLVFNRDLGARAGTAAAGAVGTRSGDGAGVVLGGRHATGRCEAGRRAGQSARAAAPPRPSRRCSW